MAVVGHVQRVVSFQPDRRARLATVDVEDLELPIANVEVAQISVAPTSTTSSMRSMSIFSPLMSGPPSRNVRVVLA
jgi:hypothetical protein